jgi:hypothetical protein
MEIQIPEAAQILAGQRELAEQLETLSASVGIAREWWDLKSACARKGINYGTARVWPEHQPNGGVPDAMLTGKKMWRWKTIEAWLSVVDKDVEEGRRARIERKEARGGERKAS